MSRAKKNLARSGLCAAALIAFVGNTGAQVIKHDSRSPVAVQQLGLTVPMRDGIHLATDVFLPGETGRWPAILVRTPYNRKSPYTESYRYFAAHGYAVVIQDVRGRHASQGVFGSTVQEGPDGSDTLNWIAAQPWSDGRVGMAGGSYLGITQWWAAIAQNPHLVTISPMCSGDDEYTDRFYSQGGALQVGHRLLWLAENLIPPSHVRPLFSSYIDHVPLQTADIPAAGMVLPPWRNAVAHPSYDAYWKRFSVRERLSGVKIPVLSWGGWFDEYAQSDLDAFSRLAKQGSAVETWIGPWAHDPGWRFPTRDFGPNADVPIRAKQLDWYNRWFHPASEVQEPAVGPTLHIFVMGPNLWREEHEWPLSRTRVTPLYLASEGGANSSRGDGVLDWQPVKQAPPDSFVYDPQHPVPTVGGSVCCEATVLPPGPLEQSPVEARRDVLVYTTKPLRDDVEVTGVIRALLYVSTSANDTDFTAKLVDVLPDGRSLLVTDGIQRLRYRVSLSEPSFVRKNAAYQITVNAGVTSYVFPQGHSIRLEVSSSNFPRFDRNLNSTLPVAEERRYTKAKQTVFHERSYPSVLVLPVIPRPSHHHNRVS